MVEGLSFPTELGFFSILFGLFCMYLYQFKFEDEKNTIFNEEMRNYSEGKLPTLLCKPFRLQNRAKINFTLKRNLDVTRLHPFITDYFSGDIVSTSGKKWIEWDGRTIPFESSIILPKGDYVIVLSEGNRFF